jgi:hypothetical protein
MVPIVVIGFSVLLAKDFVWFGHRFRSRSGFGDSREYSPIFVQFLDCVWQVWRQFPWEFEFNDNLLVAVLYSSSSRFYCDYLFDSFRERSAVFCRKKNDSRFHSVWDYISDHEELYKNPLYVSYDLSEVVVQSTHEKCAEDDFEVGSDFSDSLSASVLTDPSPRPPADSVNSTLKDLISDALGTTLPVDSRAGTGVISRKTEKILPSKLKGISNQIGSSDVIESQVVDKSNPSYVDFQKGQSMLAVRWPVEERGGPMLIDCNKRRVSDRRMSQAVRLIIPLSSVHELAIWEKAHKLPGIPFSSAKSGSSAAVERGFRDLLQDEKIKRVSLEEQLRKFRIQLDNQEQRIRELEGELVRERIPSFDDGVFVNADEEADVDHSLKVDRFRASSSSSTKNPKSNDTFSSTISAVQIKLPSFFGK